MELIKVEKEIDGHTFTFRESKRKIKFWILDDIIKGKESHILSWVLDGIESELKKTTEWIL
jgi:hypothetical protein